LTVAAGIYCGQCGLPRRDGRLLADQPSVDQQAVNHPSAAQLLIGQPSTDGAFTDEKSVGQPSASRDWMLGHASCVQRAELEPPRYCPDCARRMVVQVDPMGWRAVCSQHGELRG
jgi:hypothetical protein